MSTTNTAASEGHPTTPHPKYPIWANGREYEAVPGSRSTPRRTGAPRIKFLSYSVPQRHLEPGAGPESGQLIVSISVHMAISEGSDRCRTDRCMWDKQLLSQDRPHPGLIWTVGGKHILEANGSTSPTSPTRYHGRKIQLVAARRAEGAKHYLPPPPALLSDGQH